MEKLAGFEFIATDDGPQLVALKRKGVVILQVALVAWVGLDLRALGLDFETREELEIEGRGIGHPYWNDETPTWAVYFDGVAEATRILATRDAAIREIRRSRLTLM